MGQMWESSGCARGSLDKLYSVCVCIKVGQGFSLYSIGNKELTQEMSQETSYAAAVSGSGPQRIYAPACECSSVPACGRACQECLWLCPAPCWVWALGSLRKLPSPCLWAVGTLHIIGPQKIYYIIIGGCFEIIWSSPLRILKKLKVRGKGLV